MCECFKKVQKPGTKFDNEVYRSPTTIAYHIISSAREAAVATHAWTKLYVQIMSWVSGI